jgi:hypothetical protein
LVDRPPVAADRAVPGHWEGDLVVDNDTGGLVTVIERRSRFCLVRKLPDCRDSQTVTGLVTEMIKSLPEALFETLTWDQGQEMAEHARITVATDCGVREGYPIATTSSSSDPVSAAAASQIRPKMPLPGATFECAQAPPAARAPELSAPSGGRR